MPLEEVPKENVRQKQVGDRVRILADVEHVCAGHEGVITERAYGDDGEWLFVRVDGVVIAFRESELEPLVVPNPR